VSLTGLRDRVFIVTGGAAGIGRAAAERLLDEGARVALVDVSAARLAEADDELGGESLLTITADAGSSADIDRYFAATTERFGRVDGLFNNAGVMATTETIADTNLAALERLVRVNFVGVFMAMRKMLRVADEQGSTGVILNTSSGLGLRGEARQGAYAATKAAILSLTRTAAIEAAPHVRVNAILPGPIATEMTLSVPGELLDVYRRSVPLGRLGEPAEVAAAAAWLLSEESSFVTGSALLVDGGNGA
jgi:NAD(P)-dependent dehydrogenase (short-subunit alcohol dehydrogenase family)